MRIGEEEEEVFNLDEEYIVGAASGEREKIYFTLSSSSLSVRGLARAAGTQIELPPSDLGY